VELAKDELREGERGLGGRGRKKSDAKRCTREKTEIKDHSFQLKSNW